LYPNTAKANTLKQFLPTNTQGIPGKVTITPILDITDNTTLLLIKFPASDGKDQVIEAL